MLISPAEWHNRFLIQTQWTARIREYIFSKIPLPSRAKILEVGCGTGALLSDIAMQYPHGQIIGLDINPLFLQFAHQNNKSFFPVQGDGYTLPFESDSMDLVYCHYFLLWITQTHQVMNEIKRVLNKSGVFIAFAEPDYLGRIDYPNELADLGKLQNAALHGQGIRLDSGRQLPQLLEEVGLHRIQVGVLGGQWDLDHSAHERSSEWSMLRHDLFGLDQEELSNYERLDAQARKQGRRVLYVPTFYALGYKSSPN